jgi:hypothetical protein
VNFGSGPLFFDDGPAAIFGRTGAHQDASGRGRITRARDLIAALPDQSPYAHRRRASRRFRRSARTAAERRRRYAEDGFVAGGPLLEPHEVDRLNLELDRLFPDTGAPRLARHKHFTDGIGGEYHAVYELHRLSPAYEEVLRHPRLAQLLVEITGTDSLRVLLDQIQYKPALTGGWNGWHRDMPSFPLIRPYTALTAWIALDDATEENGCMRMVPGSHCGATRPILPATTGAFRRFPASTTVIPSAPSHGRCAGATCTFITRWFGTARRPTRRGASAGRSRSSSSARAIAIAKAGGSRFRWSRRIDGTGRADRRAGRHTLNRNSSAAGDAARAWTRRAT